jgi:hypothetical protein
MHLFSRDLVEGHAGLFDMSQLHFLEERLVELWAMQVALSLGLHQAMDQETQQPGR